MSGWIGVDLDGTLAHYDGWVGSAVIGAPIPAMVERVRAWLDKGRDVRVFTARMWPITKVLMPDESLVFKEGEASRLADVHGFVTAYRIWCRQHIGVVLPVKCVKDYGMVELWDDRAVRVVKNTGRPCCGG